MENFSRGGRFRLLAISGLIGVILLFLISNIPIRGESPSVDDCIQRSWMEEAKETHDNWISFLQNHPDEGDDMIRFRESNYTRLEWELMWSERYSIFLENIPMCDSP